MSDNLVHDLTRKCYYQKQLMTQFKYHFKMLKEKIHRKTKLSKGTIKCN